MQKTEDRAVKARGGRRILRLTREGVAEDDFRRRFGVSLEEVYGQVIGDLVEAGLLVRDAVGLRLSGRGRLLGNQVFAQFLPG